MKSRTSKKLLLSLCICILGIIACLALSSSFRARVYRAVSFGGSYSTYDRLADMLRLGMSADEARGILGGPESQEDLERGQRWWFFDEGATAGWICIVDFSSDRGALRVAYFLNVQQRGDTNGLYRQFGSPVDGGELFRSDPFLKMPREQLHRVTRSNN